MFKFLRLAGMMFLLSVTFSCEYPDSVGLDLVEEDQFDLIYLDTATVRLSTVLFDSVATSGNNRMLTGHHEDETFGGITATSYFEVGLDSLTTYPDEKKAAYSRTSLLLYYDDYSYYDTMQVQTYYLYELNETMKYRDDGSLYNTSRFAYENGLDSFAYIGKISLAPQPLKDEYAEMSLDDTWGQQLFNLVTEKNDTIKSASFFQKRYKGFVLVPDQHNTAIIGLSNASRIKIYYSQGGEEQGVVFPVASHVYFTQYDQDRKHTAFASLSQQKQALSSDTTGHVAYLQGGVGTALRIEFPLLKSLLAMGNGVYITEAYLTLKVMKGSYDGLMPLPQTLSVYHVDGLNRIQETYDGTFTFYEDQEYKEDTYFSLPVASFLNEQMNRSEDNEDALLITLPEASLGTTVDRLIVGDQQSVSPTKVQLFVLKNYKQ